MFVNISVARAGNNHKGGRPKGKKSKTTLDREEALKQWRERVQKNVHRLLDSQFTLARGLSYLYRIDKEFVRTGKKGGFYRNKKPILVTNPEEIRQYIEDEVVDGDVKNEKDPAASYYFITAEKPNNDAIDSMMDRTFGKAAQGLQFEDSAGNSFQIASISVQPIIKKEDAKG